MKMCTSLFFGLFVSSRRRHTRFKCDWSSDVCSSDLASLTQTRAAGYGLCFFEDLVRIAPTWEQVKSLNICRVCHARVLAEHLEKAPIYWPNCPYVNFHKP